MQLRWERDDCAAVLGIAHARPAAKPVLLSDGGDDEAARRRHDQPVDEALDGRAQDLLQRARRFVAVPEAQRTVARAADRNVRKRHCSERGHPACTAP